LAEGKEGLTMRTRRFPSHHRRGFTLIEVLIVIALLLAIGGLVVVNLLPAKGQADIDLQRVQFDQVDGAMKKFKLDMTRYPSEEEGLAALTSKDAISDENEKASWRGPYMEDAVLQDKWHHDVVYHFPGQLVGEETYDLISFGPDGQEGTPDDITNHDRKKGADGEFNKGEENSFAPSSGSGSGETKSGS
jgi:general secretion pathway protein G